MIINDIIREKCLGQCLVHGKCFSCGSCYYSCADSTHAQPSGSGIANQHVFDITTSFHILPKGTIKERRIKTRKYKACNNDKDLNICWYSVSVKVKILLIIIGKDVH